MYGEGSSFLCVYTVLAHEYRDFDSEASNMAAYGHVVAALYLVFVCLLVCNAHPLDDFNDNQDDNPNRMRRAAVPAGKQNFNPILQPLNGQKANVGNGMRGGGGAGVVNEQHMGVGNAPGGGMRNAINNQFGGPALGGNPNVLHQFQQQGQGRMAPPASEPKSPFISASPECQSDVAKYCSEHSRNNFAVIDCLESDLNVSGMGRELSPGWVGVVNYPYELLMRNSA